MVTNNQQFSDLINSLRPAEYKHTPVSYFDEDGDCIEFFVRRDMYYARRIDNLLTFYFSQESDELVGLQIKGARKFLETAAEKYPQSLGIKIQQGKVKLSILFNAHFIEKSFSDEVTQSYEQASDLIDGSRAFIDTECCSMA